MTEKERQEKIAELQREIESLPKGYISTKTVKGNPYYYHQWSESGKKKSRYLKTDEVESLKAQIAQRKNLQAQVKLLRSKSEKEPVRVMEELPYRTNVTTGEALKKLLHSVRRYEKRDSFEKLHRYLYGSGYGRVCILYGLRRTGKTTLLFQAMAEMTLEDFAKAVYIKLRPTDEMDMVARDLDQLQKEGYQYIFLDEVTLMKDFIDSAALFSDIYAMMGMKIVLSGTDSLGFWIARDYELYDRERTIHTTFIPFREYSRLLGIDSIDEYIRYGGTLRAGELAFDDEDVLASDAAFRDDENTRRYIDTAIAKNIQHSLECYEYGNHFYHLYPLYEKGELTGAINRIVEDMNHRFVLEVLTRDFVSHDLGISARNLRQERNPEIRTRALYEIDRETVTKRLKDILEIRNQEEQTIGLNDGLVNLIKNYLKDLDLIVNCPIESAEAGLPPQEHMLFLQPGMRYCQAQALVYSLMKDDYFKTLEEGKRTLITERILEEVRGRMLEDIVLLETTRALPKRYRVFKLAFRIGEYDMVIYDKDTDACAAYEIKHSSGYVREQARHLMDEEKLALTSPRYGTLAGRYVLYLGEDMDTEDGIAYRNAEQFLKNLPEITLASGLEETASKDENPGMTPTM